eukprot:220520-Amphidinium_carterae.1
MGIATITDYRHYDGDVGPRLIGSIQLVSITTLVIAVCTSMRWHQQQVKPQMYDASTQTDQSSARECGVTRVIVPEDILVYPQVQGSDEYNIRSTLVHKMLDLWMRLTHT